MLCKLPAWQKNTLRILYFSCIVALTWSIGQSTAFGQEAGAAAAEEGFFERVLRSIFTFDTRSLMEALGRPEYAIPAFIILNVIVFTETGLLIGFFLPGDSLLVITGLLCANEDCRWNMPLLLVTLSLSAIIGDTVGYWIGFKSGPKIFSREKSFFFHKDHLLKAQAFYEKHGGKTIILARFMPFLRTFAPVVAGVGKMEYRQFVFFNVFGGIAWVFSMVLAGRYLLVLINPLLRPYFGETFTVADHVDKVVIIVVVLSVLPMVVGWLKSKLSGSDPTPKFDAPATRNEPALSVK